jgi:phospholipase C
MGVSRRELVRRGAVLALGALDPAAILSRALAEPPRCGPLSEIEHVVILMQENRSFDHYFGTYRGVRGFADPDALRLHDGSGLSVFAQPGFDRPGYGGHLMPFHLDSFHDGECTNDVDHSWGPQHESWARGRMDGFVRAHAKADGAASAPLTMGYYTRADLPFYFALADAFTICDRYHCSVIGPTDPNRLYMWSATLGEDGSRGGPILSTSSTRIERFGSLRWTTMPEQLEARGISWKVYGTPDANLADNVLPYFRSFQTNPTLIAKSLVPTFPGTFELDVASGGLPSVSWVLAPLIASEHPPAPSALGELAVARVVAALVSNPEVWRKTVLFVTYDENGGFFDHVPPPTPPRGTPGEFLTVPTLPAAATGVRGPIGLGFRVPTLAVSPYSRGGFVCSDPFDHTSLLRFIEARFGAEVPNLTEWRRSVTGDLTSALNVPADHTLPRLPQPSAVDRRVITGSCAITAPLSLATDATSALKALEEAVVPEYPVPANRMPTQEGGPPSPPRRPSGLGCAPPVLSVALRGVPAHATTHGFRARVVITDVVPLRRVHVRINGRIVRRTRRPRFGFSVHARQLRAGRNRITVSVSDIDGRHVKRSVVVRRAGLD